MNTKHNSTLEIKKKIYVMCHFNDLETFKLIPEKDISFDKCIVTKWANGALFFGLTKKQTMLYMDVSM